MSINKKIKTQYDPDEEKYIKTIKESKNEEEIEEAKSKLNELTKSKYDNIDQYTLSQEIEARYSSGNSGIYKSNYKKYAEIIESGTDEEILQASKELLAASDSMIYSDLVKERKENLKKEKAEEDNKKPKEDKINTPKQGEDGSFTLKDNTPSKTTNSIDLSTLDYDVTKMDRRTAWIETNTEYHRKKTKEGIAVDSAILKRYYSSMDAEIYFGNEYVEDIYDINWTIVQNTEPLFGYNSYTYDEIAKGNRLIRGTFMINFTSPNYLFSILKEANKANTSTITNMTNYNVPALSADIKPTFRAGTMGSTERGHHAPMWPETFDIDIIFGEKSGAGDPVHVIILGVAIHSCSIALSAGPNSLTPQPDGSSIYEIYQFIAQDIRTEVFNISNETSDYEETTKIENGTDTTSDEGEDKTEQDKKARQAKEIKDEIEKTIAQKDNVELELKNNIGTTDISNGSNLSRQGAQRNIKYNQKENSYEITFSYPYANENKESIKRLAESDMAFITSKNGIDNYNVDVTEINEKDKIYKVKVIKKN